MKYRTDGFNAAIKMHITLLNFVFSFSQPSYLDTSFPPFW